MPNLTMAELPPTVRQLELLAAIDDFTTKHGFPPTTQEMAKKFGVSVVAIHFMMGKLEKRKLLSRVPKSPRAITVTKLGQARIRRIA